jgi:hypothetical protein
MPTRIIRPLAIASLIPLATSCAGTNYPASPVPAAMTETQAIKLADIKLAQRDMAPRVLVGTDQKGDGWLLAYESPFNTAMMAPKESRLVEVLNTGEVREIRFRKNH